MSFNCKKKLPSVEEVLSQMPLDANLKKNKAARDKEIAAVFTGQSNKFILIIGPCSADNEGSVMDYISRLQKLGEKVKDKLIIIPRIYTNKPRTKGTGYKGLGHQPDPNEEPDIVKGLLAIRKLHVRVIRETGLSAADEMLYPGNYAYLEDVLSYVAVGARSVENQKHRLTASGVDIPVGMKNPTSGDLNVMMNAIFAGQSPHIFAYNGWEVETPGNPLTHAILRGATDPNGVNLPNYHYEDMSRLLVKYTAKEFANPAIIVDANHSNSDKKFAEQPRICMEVLESMRKSQSLRKTVKGLMVESYIEEGGQGVDGGVYGKSITDPCLGWKDSEKLVFDIAENLSKL